MKKALLFILMASFCSAQHPDLVNNNWKITFVEDELHPSPWFAPPMTYNQVTKFSTVSPQLSSSFFNLISANLDYIGQDSFTVSNKTCTNEVYTGDNGEVNQFFSYLCTFFEPSFIFHYYIQNNGNTKTLVITTPIFQQMHFEATNLTVEDNKLPNYSIAPNPVKDFLTVENTSGINTVSVFDISGKLVYQMKYDHAKTQKIDLQSLKTGTYFIKVNNEKMFKIVKE